MTLPSQEAIRELKDAAARLREGTSEQRFLAACEEYKKGGEIGGEKLLACVGDGVLETFERFMLLLQSGTTLRPTTEITYMRSREEITTGTATRYRLKFQKVLGRPAVGTEELAISNVAVAQSAAMEILSRIAGLEQTNNN